MKERISSTPEGNEDQEIASFESVTSQIDNMVGYDEGTYLVAKNRGDMYNESGDIDLYKAPSDESYQYTIGVLKNNENNESIRIISQLYYQGNDRGSFGIKLYEDGRTARFRDSELHGFEETSSEPGDNQDHLDRASRMLSERQESIDRRETERLRRIEQQKEAQRGKVGRTLGRIATKLGF